MDEGSILSASTKEDKVSANSSSVLKIWGRTDLTARRKTNRDRRTKLTVENLHEVIDETYRILGYTPEGYELENHGYEMVA